MSASDIGPGPTLDRPYFDVGFRCRPMPTQHRHCLWRWSSASLVSDTASWIGLVMIVNNKSGATLKQESRHWWHVLLGCKLVRSVLLTIALVPSPPHYPVSAWEAEFYGDVMIHKAPKWILSVNVKMFIDYSGYPDKSIAPLRMYSAWSWPSSIDEAPISASHCSPPFGAFHFYDNAN